MKSIITTIKKPAVYIGIGVLILLIVTYFLTLSPKTPKVWIATVTKGNVVAETLLTGTVKPARFAELSFNRSGVLSSFPSIVGKTVNAGAILATLKNDAENAAVTEAQATRKVAETKLAEVLRGARVEEIRVKEAAVSEKEIVFQNLAEKSSALIADAYSASNEALNRYADQLFSNDESLSPQLSFSSGNQSGVYETEVKRVTAGIQLKALRTRVSGYSEKAEAALEGTLEDLRVILDLFLSIDAVLNDGSGLSESTLADYKEKIATARGKIVSSITATQNHLNALRESESALRKAESELSLSKAGATTEEISRSKEELAQTKAKQSSAEIAFEETLLRAPFAGRVTSRRGSSGETVSSSENIITLEGAGGFIIEAEVPEADITKIKIGDMAAVTLDAYGANVSFAARITEIEQSEEVVEGVSTYKTTFAFLNNDERLRSGMTANITIATSERNAVLVLPLRAIEKSGGKNMVTVLNNDGARRTREVTVGLRGSDGFVEIVSGLAEGEKVLMPTTK